jgi:hypothetical protein
VEIFSCLLEHGSLLGFGRPAGTYGTKLVDKLTAKPIYARRRFAGAVVRRRVSGQTGGGKARTEEEIEDTPFSQLVGRQL